MNMNVAHDVFDMIGFLVGRDRVNFTNKINKMTKKIQIWSQRNLTLVGRNLVSTTFGTSNLIYSLSLAECETSNIKEIPNGTK